MAKATSQVSRYVDQMRKSVAVSTGRGPVDRSHALAFYTLGMIEAEVEMREGHINTPAQAMRHISQIFAAEKLMRDEIYEIYGATA